MKTIRLYLCLPFLMLSLFFFLLGMVIGGQYGGELIGLFIKKLFEPLEEGKR